MSNLLNIRGVKFFAIIVLAVALLATFGMVAVGRADAASCSMTATLRAGSTGAEVMCLQSIVGATADGKFGPMTRAAVMAWQSSHGLVADGVVGPMTRAALMAQSSGTVSFAPEGCTSASGYSIKLGLAGGLCHVAGTPATGCQVGWLFNPLTGASCTGSSGGLSGGGETSIDGLDVKDADDDSIDESSDKAPVADIQFDVSDADAQLVRADIVFQADDGNASGGEVKPWRVFNKVYALDGTKVLASVDASDRDNWDETDDVISGGTNQAYSIRLNDINKTYKEGSNNNSLKIAVDVASSVDGSESGDEDWTVGIENDGLRFEDAAGIETFEGTGSTSDTASFSIESAGAQSDVHVTKDSSSPDAQTLQVKTSSSTTETVAIFRVKVDSDGNDVKIDDFPIELVTSRTTGNKLADVVDDVFVELDGSTYSTDTNPSTSLSTQTFAFTDIDDDDVVVGAGETMLVTVKVKFKSQGSGPAYANGTTIQANADTDGSDYEDADTGDSAGDVSGTADGEVMTLAGTGISVQPSTTNATVTLVDLADNDLGVYTIKVDVTAFDEDAYISQTGTTAYTARIEDASNGVVCNSGSTNGTTTCMTPTSTSTVISSTADTSGSSFKINEGDTETFTFTITANPVTGDEGRSLRAQLLTIVSGTSAGTPTGNTFTIGADNLSDYRTNGVVIPD